MIASEVQPLATMMYDAGIGVKELEYIAFSGQHESAHGIFRSIPTNERIRFASKYILSEVIFGGTKKLRTFLAASAEVPAAEEKAFIEETLNLFIRSCRNSGAYPRELFESLLLWSGELTKLSLLSEAIRYYDEAFAMGVNKFPDLYSRTLVDKAGVLNTLGRFGEAQDLLLNLADRPYILPDRKLLPTIVFCLGQESLLKGDVEYYKRLLFRGLKHFYTSLESRQVFVDQPAQNLPAFVPHRP